MFKLEIARNMPVVSLGSYQMAQNEATTIQLLPPNGEGRAGHRKVWVAYGSD